MTDLIEHQISPLGSPVWVAQRPIVYSRLSGLLDTIDDMLKQQTLLPSDSEWNFPIVPVLKREDPSLFQDKGHDKGHDKGQGHGLSIRLTVDYSRLNAMTPRDRVSVGSWDDLAH